MRIELPYGHGVKKVNIPAGQALGIFGLPESAGGHDEGAIIQQALEQPIGSPPLHRIVRPEDHVTIVTSDLTRPCPSERLLPPMLDALNNAGIPDAHITVILALGLHRAMTEDEIVQAFGAKIRQRVCVLNHDPNNTLRLGVTSRGTPVELFRPLVEADRRICLGNLEFHYFAGFSGGAKAILPGCASRSTVNANHALMVQPGALAGRIEGNPVRADLEEGVAMLGVDFIVNAVMDEAHHITDIVAGEVTAAHRAGCEIVAQRGLLTVPDLAEIVLVSAGGSPKDLNLYQAQKALDNAAYAVQTGGIIILLAECPEGFGNATFQKWLCEAGSPQTLLQWIQQEFVLGGHKAAAIGAVLQRAEVYLVSNLPADLVEHAGLRAFSEAQDALNAARQALGPAARISIFPQGGSVLPQPATRT